ncbi:uncharacterized protein LOC129583408 isoform X2 [Paramacrobiotus metropolitanus]|nr:uncharacterized protein LOC129583408 isoform X2 [Paramacrobiotus metropolitanus]
MLAEAWLNNRQDDRIILTQLTPSDFVMDSVVYRPRLGTTVTFQCEVPAGSDGRDVSWLHQDRTVYEAGQPCPLPVDDTTGQLYNFARVNNTLVFQVLNVSLVSGGSVQCIAAPSGPSYTSRPRVLQRFALLPLITRRDDVFVANNQTAVLTATEGDHVAVPCRIRLPLPGGIFRNLRNHIIWRRNGRVVHGPSEAPYGSLIAASGIPQATATPDRQPTNRPGQMTDDAYNFRHVKLTAAGEVQCLFRPHQGIHEWIAQTTTLTVLAKN